MWRNEAGPQDCSLQWGVTAPGLAADSQGVFVCVSACACASRETHTLVLLLFPCLCGKPRVSRVASSTESLPLHTRSSRSREERLPSPAVFTLTRPAPRVCPVSHVCRHPCPLHRRPPLLRCPHPRGRPGFPTGPSLSPNFALAQLGGSTSHTSPPSTGPPPSPAWAWATCSEPP